MNQVELYLINEGDNCTIYTLQFLRDTESEFEKFISRFINNAEYSEDYSRIALSYHELPVPEHRNDISDTRAR